MSKVKKCHMLVEVVCLPQTVAEMLKCHTHIWLLLRWDLVSHEPIFGRLRQFRVRSLFTHFNWTLR